MCSFGSCQTRFEFLSQFRKVRNAFECFVKQVQTRLPKTKCVWPMKINVICTVHTVGLIGVSPEYDNEYVCDIESVTGTGPSHKYTCEQEDCDAEASTSPQ